MLAKLLLLGIAILGYFWLKSWYKSLDKEAQKKALWNIAVVGLVVIMLIAVATGRMHWAGLAFAFVLGLLRFVAMNAIRYAPFILSIARKQNFSTPEFKTPYLNVKIKFGNQVTLEGSILDGPHKGKDLNDLSQEDLIELANFYKEHCKRSYYLIMIMLQKGGGAQGQQQSFVDNSGLTREEAIQILGLQQGFNRDDVKLAHRRLMQKLHPDKGGNEWLASRVNLAKDLLLKE